MQKIQTPKRISLSEMVKPEADWNTYSKYHDSFLEIMSYENRKFFSSDIWTLNYI